MKLKTFRHGTHPPQDKERTAENAIEIMPPPEKVFIPLLQHFGSPAMPLVKKGEDVYLGQKIGESHALFSAPVHSSVSGKILAIEDYNHPSGIPLPVVIIANDGQDRPGPEKDISQDPFCLSREEIRQRVKEAGVVGLGGAAFPTAVKLSPPKDKLIDTIIINGCECEPILTSDYRLMVEYPEEILKGAELVRLATGANLIIVGVEDNKPRAAEILKEHIHNLPAEIALLRTKYPQGAEKNLISALLDREVPRGGLPFDVRALVQNVGTAKAIWEAVSWGEPLYKRAITVSGDAVREPKNLLVRIGTPFQKIIDFCGGLEERANIVVMGGPMMGISQWTLDAPLIKGTTGLLAWTVLAFPREHSCIRCARCVEHCPMGLVPTQLAKFVQYEKFEEAEKWGILDCVECGCCQYICPAKISLVHWIRLGKNKISSLKRKKSA